MKKQFLRLAALTAASVFSFLLCGTAVSASANEVIGTEAVSTELYSALTELGYSDSQIMAISSTYKIADSFLIVYTLSGKATGSGDTVVASMDFNDLYLDFCGTTQSSDYAQQTNKTNGTGMESVTMQKQFDSISAEMPYMVLKFFWANQATSFESNLGEAGVLLSIAGNSYSISSDLVCLGDIDGNNIINQTDITYIANAIAGVGSLTVSQRLAADVNLDGVVSEEDISAIIKWLNDTEANPIWID